MSFGLPSFGASQLLGGFGGGGDPGKKQWAQMLAQYNMVRGQNAGLFANAFQQQRKGLGAIKQGYGAALNETNAQQATAHQGVMDREKSNLGALRSTLAGSGMGGGTLDANLQRGVFSDTNRSLANVDSHFAAMRQNLATERSQLEANQYGALAGLFQNQAGQSNQLGMSLFDAIGNQQHPDPNAGWNALLGLGGTLGSAALLGSDRRFKTDIVDLGGGEYEWTYIGHEGRYRGVMADEWPEATVEIDGYLFVDYSRVPIAFRKVA